MRSLATALKEADVTIEVGDTTTDENDRREERGGNRRGGSAQRLFCQRQSRWDDATYLIR